MHQQQVLMTSGERGAGLRACVSARRAAAKQAEAKLHESPPLLLRQLLNVKPSSAGLELDGPLDRRHYVARHELGKEHLIETKKA